jgi:hypothetical protein
MAHAGTLAAGAADMQLDLLSDLFIDEKRAVADAMTMIEAALRKSDKLMEDDASPVAKVVRDMVSVEEACLDGARVRLAAARDRLTAYTLAKLGSGPRATIVHAVPNSDVAEKQEKNDKKLLKRKLLAPKDDWLDKKV